MNTKISRKPPPAQGTARSDVAELWRRAVRQDQAARHELLRRIMPRPQALRGEPEA